MRRRMPSPAELNSGTGRDAEVSNRATSFFALLLHPLIIAADAVVASLPPSPRRNFAER
jgi:hypothetical protein